MEHDGNSNQEGGGNLNNQGTDSDQRPSNVYIGNINAKATEEEFRSFLETNGINLSGLRNVSFRKGFAFLSCPTKVIAEEIIYKLNGLEFLEKKLVVEFSLTSSISRGYDNPLKILVASECIGAIIGRGGSNIKDMTRSTGARINILKNSSPVATAEKVISISADENSIFKACRKILEICTQESQNMKPGREPKLKILALNTIVGRVIGKEGKNIKRLIEETQTKIYVSSQVPKDSTGLQTASASAYTHQQYWDPVTLNEERVITIYGSVDGICKATEQIYSKLRVGNHPNLGGNRIVYIPSTNFFPAPEFRQADFKDNSVTRALGYQGFGAGATFNDRLGFF